LVRAARARAATVDAAHARSPARRPCARARSGRVPDDEVTHSPSDRGGNRRCPGFGRRGSATRVYRAGDRGEPAAPADRRGSRRRRAACFPLRGPRDRACRGRAPLGGEPGLPVGPQGVGSQDLHWLTPERRSRMAMLRQIEHKIESLFEGIFGRAFRTHVQPVELARKLAKEMDEGKTVSVSRVYVPNEYSIYLAPDDREQFSS